MESWIKAEEKPTWRTFAKDGWVAKRAIVPEFGISLSIEPEIELEWLHTVVWKKGREGDEV
jgi:hypothetical protein